MDQHTVVVFRMYLVNNCALSIYFFLLTQIHHVIKFSFVFGLTDSYSQLYNHSTNMKIELDLLYTELKHEKITKKIPAIFLSVMNCDMKSCKSSSSLLCSDLIFAHVEVLLHQRNKQASTKKDSYLTDCS